MSRHHRPGPRGSNDSGAARGRQGADLHPGRRRLQRGRCGLERRARRPPAGPRGPLHRRGRRDRGGRLRAQHRPDDRRPRWRPQRRRFLDLRRRDRDRPLADERRPRRPCGHAGDRRRRRGLGRRRPRDASARARDHRRPRLDARASPGSRSAAASAGRCGSSGSRATTWRRPTSSPRTAGLLHASESENADLLWGLRGGGGNFGIVTQFEFDLHPLGPMVYAGPIFYPADAAPDLLRAFRDWARRALPTT